MRATPAWVNDCSMIRASFVVSLTSTLTTRTFASSTASEPRCPRGPRSRLFRRWRGAESRRRAGGGVCTSSLWYGPEIVDDARQRVYEVGELVITDVPSCLRVDAAGGTDQVVFKVARPPGEHHGRAAPVDRVGQAANQAVALHALKGVGHRWLLDPNPFA